MAARHILEKRREGMKVRLARRGLAPGKPDLAFGLWRREMHEADVGTPVHLARHRHLRQKRDAIAMGDHLHDGGEARGPEALPRLRRHQAAKGQRLVAQAMTFLQEQAAARAPACRRP